MHLLILFLNYQLKKLFKSKILFYQVGQLKLIKQLLNNNKNEKILKIFYYKHKKIINNYLQFTIEQCQINYFIICTYFKKKSYNT